VVLAPSFFAIQAGWGLLGELDGRGVFGALRIYLQQWNFNGSFYHWLEVSLSGVRTSGAVPLTPDTENAILVAKLISFVALALSLAITALLAWKLQDPTYHHRMQILNVLRLAALPTGAYLILTPTVHPWYLSLILPWLPFIYATRSKEIHFRRFIWPWIYLSWSVGISYLTYINPMNLHEYERVRQIEYLPFFGLLLWASFSIITLHLKRANRERLT
jgi:hypothetical protein